MGNIFSITLSCDALFSCCLDCTGEKLTTIGNLEDNIDVLQIEMQKLIETRNDVMRRVTIAEQQEQMTRTDQVQGWFTRVQLIEAEVDELVKLKSQEIEKLCFGGLCSMSCRSSYKFGKKVAKKLQVLSVLKSEGGFQVVAERKPGVLVDERPVEPTVGLDSMFDRVWRCIMEEKVGIIGLYGMGGVGKTTLLTQINNKFLQMQDDFDVVIWIVVSKDMQLGKIQESIGKKIGLVDESWKNKSFEDKAIEIFKCLRKKKFVLLLDDIWELVDLTEVGVPLPSHENIASKVVFTTRFIDVCGQMGAHEKFEVHCLTDKESRNLFHEKVGNEVINSHPDIPRLAETLIKECGGLPLALITIGRAMAGMKTPQEWEYAIEVLRTSGPKFTGIEEKVYSRLKFSYDSLPNDTIRSCLLYCSLYPEDYSISKRELIDCWIGEGLLNEYDGSRARNQGYYIIGVLLRTCLLEDACLSEEEKDDDYIKMHDVIRNMMLWIACESNDGEKEKEKVLVCAGAGLTKAPEVEKWERVSRVSLMENQIKNISEIPTCPHLLSLFLNSNRLESITSDFFKFMPSLRVLNISKNLSLFELPSGISKLASLQQLDLSKTNIKRLPKELEALSNLKCLNLENTYSLSTIPRNLIKKFSRLEVLRMFKCNFLIAAEDSQFFVEELCCLEHLNVLTISLKNGNALQQLLTPHNLRSCTQSLCLKWFYNSMSLKVSRLAEMKNLESLYFYECRDLEELRFDCVRNIDGFHGFYNLHTVDICSCFKLRDLTWLVLAPNLKRLRVLFSYMEEIISLEKLEKVSDMMRISHPFEKLEFLELRYLRKLRCIYRNPLPFQQLREIWISDCPELEKLPLNSDSTKERKIVIVGEKCWRKKLQWEDQATQDAFLPCFQYGDDDSETEGESDAETELEYESEAELEDVCEATELESVVKSTLMA